MLCSQELDDDTVEGRGVRLIPSCPDDCSRTYNERYNQCLPIKIFLYLCSNVQHIPMFKIDLGHISKYRY